METLKVLGLDESLKLFNTLSHAHQLAVMMARTRLARCQACPQEWPLAHKVGVADLCNGGIQEPTASDLGTARALIAEMEQPTGHPYKASTTSPLCEVCGERKINRYGTHGLPGLEQGDQQAPAEWSGSQCPVDPDGCWIDDETEEHVNAKTAYRTAGHPVTA